jgi:hypothetical protein
MLLHTAQEQSLIQKKKTYSTLLLDVTFHHSPEDQNP